MQISLSRSQSKAFLLMGMLALTAVVLSALPSLGLGGFQHYLLYLVATGGISLQDFILRVLGMLPGWVIASIGKDGIIASLQWIYGWVSSEGIAAIGEAIAALSATGIGGLIVGVIGAAALG